MCETHMPLVMHQEVVPVHRATPAYSGPPAPECSHHREPDTCCLIDVERIRPSYHALSLTPLGIEPIGELSCRLPPPPLHPKACMSVAPSTASDPAPGSASRIGETTLARLARSVGT